MTLSVKQREVYHGKYFRRGGSYAICIPPDMREMMGLVQGDTVLMNCDQGILFMVRATRDMVINRKRAGDIFEKLFADKTGAHV